MLRPEDQNIRKIINFNNGVNLIIIRRKIKNMLENVIEKGKVYRELPSEM